MGRLGLMMVLSLSMVAGVGAPSLMRSSEESLGRVNAHYERAASDWSARSGAEVALATLARNTSWRGGIAERPFGSCSYAVSIDDTSQAPYVVVRSVGAKGAGEHTIEVVLDVSAVPDAVQAAVTTFGPEVKVKSNGLVDGRNHDLNGNLIAGGATLGVWTTAVADLQGDVGGGAGPVEFAPSGAPSAQVYKETAVYGAEAPEEPADVFADVAPGLTDAELRAVAASGKDGSQYVEDLADLQFPLSGVTYIDYSKVKIKGLAGDSLEVPEGTGVLIVHDPDSRNAKVVLKKDAFFQGLVIADSFKVTKGAKLVGAAVVIGDPNDSKVKFVVKKDGQVLFSKDAVSTALAPFATESAKFKAMKLLAYKTKAKSPDLEYTRTAQVVGMLGGKGQTIVELTGLNPNEPGLPIGGEVAGVGEVLGGLGGL